MALRPRDRPSSIVSRYGSQALEGPGERSPSPLAAVEHAPESVVTSLAGFESGSGSVVGLLAGFAGGNRPQPPGGRTAMPAAFKYPVAVSRRTPVAFSMRRSGQPNCPSAITCCLFSSLKTLLTLRRIVPRARFNVLSALSVGRFSLDPHWPVLPDPRGTPLPSPDQPSDHLPLAAEFDWA